MVSIIIPCYNYGEYVSEAIESALAQTYREIEIILVDDGSDDFETIEILKRWGEHPNIKLIHTEHVGLPSARNAGINEASGEYIMPLDADNRYAPTYVEKAVKIAEDNLNAGIVYGDAELFGEQSGPWALPEFSIEQMLMNNVIDAAALFRKSDWEQVGGYSEQMKYGMEDYDLWLSILELGREIVKIPETLFYYRVHSDSMVHQLQNNSEHVKYSFECLYRRHSALYQANALEHSLELRKRTIDMQAYIKALENALSEKNESTKRINELELAYEEISNAFFWKITKPFRVILDWIKTL